MIIMKRYITKINISLQALQRDYRGAEIAGRLGDGSWWTTR